VKGFVLPKFRAKPWYKIMYPKEQLVYLVVALLGRILLEKVNDKNDQIKYY
jgi:hypothetical protein